MVAAAELERRKRMIAMESDISARRTFYQQNPIEYFKDRFGIQPETIQWGLSQAYDSHKWDGTPDPFKRVLDSLVASKWVGVESATGTGKTHLGALIVYWFLDVFENSIVVTTAPKQDQLLLHIWKEMGKNFHKFAKGELTTLKLRMIPNQDSWLAVGFVAGVKANEESSTKAQGFHAEHMLIIFEETPGIPHPVITAFQNTCTAPHNLILAFGNPDHQLDNLHKFCTLDNVEHIRVSGLDHPNYVLDNPNFIPGATSRAGVNRMKVRYGEDNPLFLSRARGISPAQGIDSLVKIEWIMEAVKLAEGFASEKDINGQLGLGVDVANSEMGDKAAICYGKGNICLKIDDFQCPDSNQLGHMVYRIAKEQNISFKHIGIDGVGVGAGTINTLKEYGIKDKNVNIQSAEKPIQDSTEENFNNLRSQMYWAIREDLRNARVGIPNDLDLIADLSTPKFKVERGMIIVESKEDIKKRLGRSPNKGDAFVYWNWVRTKRGRSSSFEAKIL